MSLIQSKRKRRCLYVLTGLFLLLGVVCWIWEMWGRGYVMFNPQPISEYSSSRYSQWNASRRIFESGGERLEGWFLEKEGAPLLVFCAGRGRDAGSYLKVVDACPVAKLLVNYRGFGTSTGQPSEKAVVDDMINIVETVLKETGRSWEQVVLVGNSLGAGVVTRIAARRPAGRLILCVPFESFEACAARFAPEWVASLLFGDTFRSDVYASRINTPVLVLAATHDREVPVEQARRLSGRFKNCRYREFPAGHESLWNVAEFEKELRLGICGHSPLEH